MNTVILVLLGSEETVDAATTTTLTFDEAREALKNKSGDWQEAGFYAFGDGFYRNQKGQWRMGFLVDQWGVKWNL